MRLATLGTAVPECLGGANTIYNMVVIETRVKEHFDADPLGTLEDRRRWVGEDTYVFGAFASACFHYNDASAQLTRDLEYAQRAGRALGTEAGDVLDTVATMNLRTVAFTARANEGRFKEFANGKPQTPPSESATFGMQLLLMPPPFCELES